LRLLSYRLRYRLMSYDDTMQACTELSGLSLLLLILSKKNRTGHRRQAAELEVTCDLTNSTSRAKSKTEDR